MGIAFLGMIELFNKMMPSHTSMKKQQEWCANNFPSFIQRDHWPPSSPDINPLGYCLWDELGKTIKWNRVASKKSLIVVLKTNCKRSIVFESCSSWINRLYRMSQDEAN